MTIQQASVPNHHADYPGFAGLSGFLAAASMAVGRQGDARLVEQLSGLDARDIVVDVGCGPGTAVRRAAKLGTSVVGIDPAPVMLRVARILTRPSDRVRFVHGTAEALPLPDASVSVVWSIASVHHWTDLEAGLREAGRVLRAGGRLVAIERRLRPGGRGHGGHGSHGWTDDQAGAFAERCLEYGFFDATVDVHTNGRRTTLSVVVTAPMPVS